MRFLLFYDKRFSNSDAPVNIGAAIGAIDVLEKEQGVYIAMHGRIYRWDRVKRDMTGGRFIPK